MLQNATEQRAEFVIHRVCAENTVAAHVPAAQQDRCDSPAQPRAPHLPPQLSQAQESREMSGFLEDIYPPFSWEFSLLRRGGVEQGRKAVVTDGPGSSVGADCGLRPHHPHHRMLTQPEELMCWKADVLLTQLHPCSGGSSEHPGTSSTSPCCLRGLIPQKCVVLYGSYVFF